MRFTRALLFAGADRDARRSLAAWRGGPQSTDDRLLRDLGDTYNRLEVYSLDIDVQRLRLKNNPSGSLAWLDARYALALAYFHTGRAKEAAQLIDSTSILHPELGGNAAPRQVHPSASAARVQAVMPGHVREVRALAGYKGERHQSDLQPTSERTGFQRVGG